LKGQLGFSVHVGDNNRLTVDRIDIHRLAYACGFREGDVIRSVDGKRLRTHKQLIEYILEDLDEGGATVAILREGQDETVLMRGLRIRSSSNDCPSTALSTRVTARNRSRVTFVPGTDGVGVVVSRRSGAC